MKLQTLNIPLRLDPKPFAEALTETLKGSLAQVPQPKTWSLKDPQMHTVTVGSLPCRLGTGVPVRVPLRVPIRVALRLYYNGFLKELRTGFL